MDNQYPDENEEYELMYMEEMEMLDELPPNEDEMNIEIAGPPPQTPQIQQTQQICRSQNSTLQSPQLSQIGNDSLVEAGGSGLVNRRLFGTPQRVASTPLSKKAKHNLTPIQEIIALDEGDHQSAAATAATAADQLNGIGLRSKRRLHQDLYGEAANNFLYGKESYEDPVAKKARIEEQRDRDAIEAILETRQRVREASQSVRKDNLHQLQTLHTFKMRNLSYTPPQWPFLVLSRNDTQRVFVRFHSDEYEARALAEVRSTKQGFGGLLGSSKQLVWAGANDIVLRRTSVAAPTQTSNHANAVEQPSTSSAETAAPAATAHSKRKDDDERLWVEKYKPRKYIDLLSDELTNRSLLYWLRMWDKAVFGKEFTTKHKESATGEWNSFNKRTGKFESNGGWRQRKTQQSLNTNLDDSGRPIQKVALLCGPPGLGKTTLAHTLARHANYVVREINASDDRSPEAFKLALENGTQMSSVMNEGHKPNCIILDEIDGAPRQSIEFLVKFVTDNHGKRPVGGKTGKTKSMLKRPIICICNDIYDPALRPLRQIAFVVTLPPIDSARLADRLVQIAHKERLQTDFGSLIALAEKSGNDVRSCISTMQFYNGQKKALTLHEVLNSNLGQKDRHQGLFDVWSVIFRVQRPKKQLEQVQNGEDQPAESQITMTNMSVSTRVRNVLDAVHSGGDYERLTQGVFENYLQQRMPDPNLDGVVRALNWFCFTDTLQRQIGQLQNYSVYPYLQFGFVAWHLLFASLAWPKIKFPTRGFEFKQKLNTQKNIFQALRKGISCGAKGVGQGHVILVETVPLLKRILSPLLRSVAIQLLSAKEKYDLKHTVDVMVNLGISYTQIKSADGPYLFQMEPDLDALAQFPDCSGVTLSYFGRQLIAREVDLERVRQATPKMDDKINKPSKTKTKTMSAAVPNHLQKLNPKRIDKNANEKPSKETVSKDFFGRIQHVTISGNSEEANSDPIVKSPIWYRYKEGFNNAVRKDVHMNELL